MVEVEKPAAIDVSKVPKNRQVVVPKAAGA